MQYTTFRATLEVTNPLGTVLAIWGAPIISKSRQAAEVKAHKAAARAYAAATQAYPELSCYTTQVVTLSPSTLQ